MKKMRLISGLTAFLIASSASAVYADTETKSSFNPKDFISYFQGNYKGDMKSCDFDVNCDNKVNILDMIYARSAVAGETKIDADKLSVEHLNYVAGILASAAHTAAQDLETAGAPLTKMTFSSDELKNSENLSNAERKMAEELNENAEFFGVNKWFVALNPDTYGAVCITGDDILQRTGAYPGMIPQTLNIPFSENLTEFAALKYYDWNSEFGKYKSINPSQGELSDFPLYSTLSERSSISRQLFTELQTLAQEFETSGRKISDGIITSESKNDFVKELTDCMPEYSEFRWQAEIQNYVIKGVVIENPRDGYSGSYPKEIPGRMNIPYSDELIKAAVSAKTDWITDYPDCITNDSEQLKYAEITEKSTTPLLNAYAKSVYASAQTLLQEYEAMGIEISFDESSDAYEVNHRFDMALKELLPAEIKSMGIRWEITAENYVVTGAVAVTEDAVGAYPNAIPADMRIPYSENTLKYASGPSEIWKEKFSEYTLDETEEYKCPPYLLKWTQKAAVNSCNANAKTIFANAQTVLQEMETRGDKLPSGMVTSEDDTDFVKGIKENLNSYTDTKWAVYISGDVITGAVYSSDRTVSEGTQYYDLKKDKFVYMPVSIDNTVFTGSYPKCVPSEMSVKYDHSLVLKYKDNSMNW